MFRSCISPQKRKHHEEYHDPDYVLLQSSPIKKLRVDGASTNPKNEAMTNLSTNSMSISNIIEHEFQNEISHKHGQLVMIETRLLLARRLLDRLRFVNVEEYYRKQELRISEGDAAAVRGETTLFEDELRGPQIAMHPSVKNVNGKRPKSFLGINETLPEHAAAQNDINTIRARPKLQKHGERRLQQLILDQGLVTDNSKEENDQLPVAGIVVQPRKIQRKNPTVLQGGPQSFNSNIINKTTLEMSSKALNVSRLNNKTKHIIVIGNTSTYIGQNNDPGTEKRPPGDNTLTHKWLVYVQSKDSNSCIESFIKKVRFYLHPSYRPNDIVDVRTPPFQIVRRGWGEFPIRIQLYFHEHLKQTSVQLIHNLVLDRTLSGMHTLGAETLMEIWLRADALIDQLKPSLQKVTMKGRAPCNVESKNCNINNINKTIRMNTSNTAKKRQTVTGKKEIDRNLFGFLEKCIEVSEAKKIEPTSVVNDSLEKISSSCPRKIICKSPQRLQNIHGAHRMSPNKYLHSQLDETQIKCTKKPTLENIKSESARSTLPTRYNSRVQPPNFSSTNVEKVVTDKPTPLENKEIGAAIKNSKSMQLTSPMVMKLSTASTNNFQNGSNNRNNNNIIALSRVGKLITPKATNMIQMTSPNDEYLPVSVPEEKMTGNSIFQKKLVQLIDADGKIKFMQVLLATTKNSTDKEVGCSKENTNVSIQETVSKFPMPAESAKHINSSSAVIMENNASKEVIKTQSPPTSTKSNQPQSNSSTLNFKSTTNSVGFPKQMVFQKEGKLFIIDPLQIKLKQERRQQVSLLKPQANWQRLYQQRIHSKALQSMRSDHDYTPSLVHGTPKASNASVNSVKDSRSIKSLNLKLQSHVSELDLGVRQMSAKAINTLELLHQLQFEQEFFTQNVVGIQSAIDYILRRLPLIAPKNTLASSFSFVCYSVGDFDALPVMKQRACEWLRAKYVTRVVRNHQYLQDLNSCKKDKFWSTREVLIYARHHAFTPKMKLFDIVSGSLLQPIENSPTETSLKKSLNPDRPNTSKVNNNSQEVSQYLGNKVKLEQNYFHYESVTPKYRITAWLYATCQRLKIDEPHVECDGEQIDVVSMPKTITRETNNCKTFKTVNLNSNKLDNFRQQRYPPNPGILSECSILVSDICRNLNIQLQPEVVERDIFLLTHTVISKCLNLFVEKLIRHTSALKQNASIADSLNITLQDIGKVLVGHAEFDFLTNKNFGTYRYDSE